MQNNPLENDGDQQRPRAEELEDQQRLNQLGDNRAGKKRSVLALKIDAQHRGKQRIALAHRPQNDRRRHRDEQNRAEPRGQRYPVRDLHKREQHRPRIIGTSFKLSSERRAQNNSVFSPRVKLLKAGLARWLI